MIAVQGGSRSRMAVRVAVGLATIGALLAQPRAIAALEAAYPLDGGLRGVAQYIVAALAAWLLAVLSTFAWAYPSWVIAGWIRGATTVEVRVLRSMVIAFLLQPAVHALIIVVAGRDLPPDRYRVATLVAQGVLLAIGLAMPTVPPGHRMGWSDRWRVMAGVSFLVTLALIARIAWADLNPDGTELLTMGRTLPAFVLPRLPTGEIPGVNLGMLPIAYPIDWLLTIEGLSPVAARLPAIVYIGLVGIGVTALVELGAGRRLTGAEFGLLLVGAAAVCLTIGLNTSYDPYSTDLASPASIDLLALAFLMAALYFLFAGHTGWCVAASALLAVMRPSALLLSLMLVAAIVLVERDPRSPRLRLAAIMTATTLLVSLFYAFAIEALAGSTVSEGGGNLLVRIRFLRFDDWERLAYLIIPSGIVPVLLFTHWRRFDHQARALTLVALAYFAFFYSLAFISLHHFAPAMLLPLVVFWRHEIGRSSGIGVRRGLVVGAGLVVAVVAALPRSFTPFRASREVGRTIAFNVGEVRGYPLIRNTFDASRVLDSLFAPYWRVRDPLVERVGDPMSLAWYAALAAPAPRSAPYVVQPEALPAPEGAIPLGHARGFALFTRDTAAWRRQRSTPPPPDQRSPLYDVPRTTLFQHLGRDAGIVQVDVRAVACGLLPALSRCRTGGG